jgi:hypothetical protein
MSLTKIAAHFFFFFFNGGKLQQRMTFEPALHNKFRPVCIQHTL